MIMLSAAAEVFAGPAVVDSGLQPCKWSAAGYTMCKAMLEYGTIMTGWDELDRFLRTDPRDVGCDQVMRILHVYVELVLDDESGAEAARRYPGVTAHLLSCGPCAEDYQGLLQAARANQE